MEKYLEMMRRVMDLSETCQEGINHIYLKLNQGNFHSTMSLFSDVLAAYASMETSIQSLSGQFKDHQIHEKSTTLKEAFNHVVSAYERGNREKVQEIFQFNLQPNYKRWKAEIERAFKTYLIS